MQFDTKRPCKTACLALAALLLAADLSVREASAKGPQPKPDFIIQTERDDPQQTFVSTGTIDTSGWYVYRCYLWDWDGEWCVYRFSDDPSGYYYFETILPGEGGDVRNVPFQLEAGPNGYLYNGVLFEGIFAGGIAKSRNKWEWILDDNGDPLFRYDYKEWTLRCLLLP